jgi:5-methyltetrahydropteroyltriglutamate--homocysteine methyltransferase
MKNKANRILTTHVGSLVRPKPFVDFLRRKLQTGVPDNEYLPALKSAVAQIVHQQVEAGIDIVSDGEFGKGIGWEQYAIERLSGFGPRQPLATESGNLAVAFRDMERFPEFYQEYWPQQELTEAIYACIGPIRYTGYEALKRDIENLKTAIGVSDVVEGFLPVVAPASAIAISPTSITKPMKSMSSRLPKRCARNIAPSSSPG